jgi:hypothetical protein
MPELASGQMPNPASENAENDIWADTGFGIQECHNRHPAGCHIRHPQMPRSASRGMQIVAFLNAKLGICITNNSALENVDLRNRPNADTVI